MYRKISILLLLCGFKGAFLAMANDSVRGFDGSILLEYGGGYFEEFDAYQQHEKADFDIRFFSQKNYTNLSLKQVFYADGVQYETSAKMPKNRLFTHSLSNGNHQFYDLHFSHDWYVSKKSTLGVVLGAWLRYGYFSADSTNSYAEHSFQTGKQDEKMWFKKKNILPLPAANVNYTYIFDEKKSCEITLNVDYNYFFDKKAATQPVFKQRDTLHAHFYGLQLDFGTNFLGNGRVEVGAKWHLSDYNAENSIDSFAYRIIDTELKKKENIGAVYFLVNKTFLKKIDLSVGLRGEYAYMWQRRTGENEKTKGSLSLLPTASIAYAMLDNWSLKANYVRSVRRPTYGELNPAKDVLDAHTAWQGNPELQVSHKDYVEACVAWRQYFAFCADFSRSIKHIVARGSILPNGNVLFLQENFGDITSYGGVFSVMDLPLIPRWGVSDERRWLHGEDAWLTFNLTASLHRFINESADGTYKHKSLYHDVSGALTAFLPSDFEIVAEMGGTAPLEEGFYEYSSNLWMNVSLKKHFLKNAFMVGLNFDNLIVNDDETKILGLPQDYALGTFKHCADRRLSLVLQYNFGREQSSPRRHKRSEIPHYFDMPMEK